LPGGVLGVGVSDPFLAGHRERDLQGDEEIDDFIARLRNSARGRPVDLRLRVPLADRRDTAFRRMKAMTQLTRDDVIREVGEVDDVTIAQIIGTGAMAEDLVEARAWLANEDALLDAGKPPPVGRVRELIDILAELATDEDADEDPGVVVGEA
jgi:hypothetical protein